MLECFVRLYNDGLIYRAKRIVNWCSALNSAISDEEVCFLIASCLLSTNIIKVDDLDLKEPKKMRVPGHGDKFYQFGAMWEFAYKVEGTGNYLFER